MPVAVLLRRCMTEVANDRRHRECDQHESRGDQPRQQRRLHEVQIGALDHHHHRAQADEQDDGVLRASAHRAPPRNARPTTVATTVATTKVAGPKRTANGLPNSPACMADSFTSTAGPTTRNTSRGSSGSMVRLAATNASASEHKASTTAKMAMVSTPRTK